MVHLKRTKTKKAYSLLELVISLAIIAIASIVMINFLITSVKVSISSLARSTVREEVSNDVTLMSRDIRNADKIVSLSCPQDGSNVCEIELVVSGNQYKWSLCQDGSVFRVCKDLWDQTTSTYINQYTSTKNVNIDFMDISYGYSSSTNSSELNIVLTISASHAITGLDINNVIRQASASTRNYEF